MPKSPWTLLAPLGCALMTTACAGSASWTAPDPRLTLPEVATRPCRLPILPSDPTRADLERGYVLRGVALVECDAARRTALDVLTLERDMRTKIR